MDDDTTSLLRGGDHQDRPVPHPAVLPPLPPGQAG